MSKWNLVQIEGKLYQDIKVTTTSGGWFIVKFSIGVAVSGKVPEGEKRKIEYIPIKFLTKDDRLVDTMVKYCTIKVVDGELRNEKYIHKGENKTWWYVSTFNVTVTPPKEFTPGIGAKAIDTDVKAFNLDDIDISQLPF